MLTLLFVVGFGMMLIGVVAVSYAANVGKSRGVLRTAILFLPVLVGAAIIVTAIVIRDNARADRMSRVTVVTGVVVHDCSAMGWSEENGSECKYAFTLDRAPYTFENKCEGGLTREKEDYTQEKDGSQSVSAVFSFSPPPEDFSFPKKGDVLRVKFVRPKNSDGKPEVLEVYNLTQEMERARSAPPSAPEASRVNWDCPFSFF